MTSNVFTVELHTQYCSQSVPMEDCIYQQQGAQIGGIMDSHKSGACVIYLLIFLMIPLESLGNEDLELLVGDDDVEPYLRSSHNIILSFGKYHYLPGYQPACLTSAKFHSHLHS